MSTPLKSSASLPDGGAMGRTRRPSARDAADKPSPGPSSRSSSESVYTPPRDEDVRAGDPRRALKAELSQEPPPRVFKRTEAVAKPSSVVSSHHAAPRGRAVVRTRQSGDPNTRPRTYSSSDTTVTTSSAAPRKSLQDTVNAMPGAAATAPSSDSYDYYSDESRSSSSNSIFSNFSGRSDYGSSLVRQHEVGAYAPLDLTGLGARESQDHRSSLVTTADLEVGVVKHLLIAESVKSYLLVRLEGLREYVRLLEAERRAKSQGPLQRVAEAQHRAARRVDPVAPTTLMGAPPSAWLSPQAFSSAELASIARQTDNVWQQHLDGFVECYLGDPVYRTALARFRKHQSTAHQYLRLPDYQENFELATSLTAQYRLSQAVARVQQGETFADAQNTFLYGASSYGRHARQGEQADTTTAFNGQPVYPQRARRGSGGGGPAWGGAATESGCAVRRWDVELLGMDAARRIRFKDDTLPWRPVRFDATAIRLEPIELLTAKSSSSLRNDGRPMSQPSDAYARHLSSPEQSVADLSGVTHSGPLVGGSINLLVEVLILTEVDAPFTFGVPRVNFTNVFMITASLFVLPDVLISKFIRLFRSVYYWQRYETFAASNGAGDAKVEASRGRRARYLHRRILQCMLAYCRCHEMDLTMRVLQRVALFIERCGFPSPLASVDTNTHGWAVSRGVLDGITLSRAATAPGSPGAPTSASACFRPGDKGAAAAGAAETKDFRVLALLSSTSGARAGAAAPGDATRLPIEAFDEDVVNGFLELSMYIQQFAHRHYRPFEVHHSPTEAPTTRGASTVMPGRSDGTESYNATRSAPLGPDGTSVHLGREATASSFAGGRVSPVRGSATPASSTLAAGRGMRTSTSTESVSKPTAPGTAASATAATGAATPTSRGLPRRPLVYLDRGEPRRHLGSTYVSNRHTAAERAARAYGGVASSVFSGGGGGSRTQGDAESYAPRRFPSGRAGPVARTPEEFFWVLRRRGGTATALGGESAVERPEFRPTMLPAETFAQQLSVLSFSLFSRIRVRELLNNAWQKVDMRDSVAGHLNELIRYREKLSLWTAALITAPREWDECQRTLRHLLEVCRRLYDQQNYEMAAAVLDGLQHDAVSRLSVLFKNAHEEPMLTTAEQRELETLTELMNPYAAYSPSSLNSVTARTAGDMDSAIIPLLAPILAVLSRAQESRSGNPAVMVREYDGQAIVVWTKVMAIGKMVNLWLRCQVTPFPFQSEPALQEYLWSVVGHQWTDEALLRVARRDKH